MRTAYIVKGYRTAVGKAPKGLFRFKRPDELAAETIEHMMKELPDFDKTRIDDVMVGNAMPEAEQGLNVGRLISLMGLKITDVPGVTVNRYCASGVETIAMATAKIQSGMADCIIAGGAESMSYIPMGGYKPTPDYKVAAAGHEDYYWQLHLMVEQDGGHVGLALLLLLPGQHSIEPADGILLQPAHGTAAVQNENKLGKIFLHNKCPPFCGVSLSLAKGYHKPEGKRSTGRRQITHPAVPDRIQTAAY